MLIVALKNHVYKFGNRTRVQNEGGPIGLKLTGEIADCIMIQWDKKLMKELEKVNIEPMVYTRFKDDIELVAESIEKGTMLVGDELIVDEAKKTEDEFKSDDNVTMEIIQQIANSINPMIKLTTETPSNSEDGMLKILDVKVKINEEEANRIDFEFYEKPTKHPKVILADSALNSSSKRTILTQECLRRLRNTKVELGEPIQVKHLNEFMIKLKSSGYNQKYRMEIVNSAMKAFKSMLEDNEIGKKPLYRSRNWNREERAISKEHKKQNWWKNNPKSNFKSVLFVPPTPGGVLAKEMQKREGELNKFSNERIKIVEGGGIQVRNILTTKNPFQDDEKCSQKLCPLCQKSDHMEDNSEERRVPCNSNNIGYRWICSTCENRNICKVYEGETARSARIRAREHITALNHKKSDSVLWKHKLTEHPTEEVKFKFEVKNRFKDALTRQANEAARIASRKNSELLNSKSEFNHPPTARIMVEKVKISKNKNTKISSAPTCSKTD